MNRPQTELVLDVEDPATAKTVLLAVGMELRRAREERGWSRVQLVARMTSGIGDRTVLSYESGSRTLTVLRLIEQCHALGVSAAGLLTMALQRARIHLENLVLLVDLHALLDDQTAKFRPMHQWARNKLGKQAGRVAEVPPSVVEELADFVGCDSRDLAHHLAKFVPDERPPANDRKNA
jgi:transcriptional regulator with XRE-family HTH domain